MASGTGAAGGAAAGVGGSGGVGAGLGAGSTAAATGTGGVGAGLIGAIAVGGLAAVVMAGSVVSGFSGMMTSIPGGMAGSQTCYDQGSGTTPQVLGGGDAVLDPLKGKGNVSSPFGDRGGTQHRGVDLSAPMGTPMYAAVAGTVKEAGAASGFGNWIVIDSMLKGKKTSTVYGHMKGKDVGVLVNVGQQVQAGQLIGKVGSEGQSSGPHLHFEVWPGGRFVKGGHAVDPEPMIERGKQDKNDLAATGESSAPAPPPPPPPPAANAAAAGPVNEQVLTAPDGVVGPQEGFTVKPRSYELRNSATIVKVGKQMGIPPKGWAIAIATAIVEGRLANVGSPAVPESLSYGLHDSTGSDHDSVGLFQQRTSQGWGSVKDLMNPEYSSKKFYEKLKQKSGWLNKPSGEVAQSVQVSAFPERYAKYEKAAAKIVLQVMGDPAALVAGGGASNPNCANGGSAAGGGGGAIAANGAGKIVIDAAMKYVGTPYVFAGGNASGPTKGTEPGIGFDCSGLTLYAYAKVGVKLEHGATAQYNAGIKVPKGQEQPGDLVFFGQPDFKHHVGIYLGNGKMLDAPESGRNVQIEKFDPREVPDYVGAARYTPKV